MGQLTKAQRKHLLTTIIAYGSSNGCDDAAFVVIHDALDLVTDWSEPVKILNGSSDDAYYPADRTNCDACQ